MENQEPVIESEPLPQIEIEVDPFESIVDNVIDSSVPVEEDTILKKDESDSENHKQTTESEIKLKTEPNQAPEIEEEKPKKKRGRPKKTKQYKNDSSSDDELPLKRPFSDLADIKSENGQEETSRRSHRSKRPSSFITKYDTGSGSDDDKLAYKGTQLSDDEYTPDKEANKKGRRRKQDSESSSLNGNAVKKLFGNDGDTSQDGIGLENIKIESVSSIKKTTQFKAQQSDAACLFLTQIMKSATNLGTFVQSKADEFITSRITTDFITDTHKLQFCMEKSFKLLELIKSNLKAIDNDLKQNYVDFIKHNKLENAVLLDKDAVKFLSEHKILFNKDGRVPHPEGKGDSDSDCEIVGEIPSTPKKDLDILKKVERNGISWKKHKGSVSSQCSDGSTKIQIPGQSAIFLNRNIQVKKVAQNKPQFESFFREDGRTLKPPDPTCQDKYKIKKLEKTTFILGWLDLAYRQVSKQFFHIVRELERKKHYESCSDLGESCSDEYSDDESVEDNAKEKSSTNARNNQLIKTLVEMCIDKINDVIRVPRRLSSKICDKPVNTKSILKYYSIENQVTRDNNCVKYSPKSLIELCINNINEIYYKNVTSAQFKKRMIDKGFNCKMSPDMLLNLCIKQINAMNHCKSSRTSKCESFDKTFENCDVSSLLQDSKESDCEQKVFVTQDTASRMEHTASESAGIIKDQLIDNLAPDQIPKHVGDVEKNQLLSNIKNEPDVDIADQSVSEKQLIDDDWNVCTENEDDPMLQVSREVYLNCEYPRKGKKALRDLLQSSSSDGEDLVKGTKKKRVVKKVKRLRKKDKNLPVREETWSFHNHLKEDPKLHQVCKVSVEKLSTSLVQPQQEDQNIQEIVSQDFEIDRLLDFSTLIPRPKTLAETTTKVSGAENQLKKKKIRERSANPCLVDFLPTVAADNSELEESSWDEESDEDIPSVNDLFNNVNPSNLLLNDTGGQLVESLENENYKEKSNLFAKKFLILSSSNDSSESDDLKDEKRETVKNKKVSNTKTKEVSNTKTKEVSNTKNKKASDTNNKNVPSTEKLNDVTKSSPVDKIEKRIHSNHIRTTLSSTDTKVSSKTNIDISSMEAQVKDILREVINRTNGGGARAQNISTNTANNIIISDSPKITSEKAKNKKSEKRKRKNKIVNESDEERRKFQRKKKRLFRNEEKRKQEREIDEISDGDSILTHSSVDSEPLVGNYSRKTVIPKSQNVSQKIKIEPNMGVTRKRSKHHNSTLYNLLTKKSSNVNDMFSYDDAIDVEEDASKRRKKLREMIDQDRLLATTKLAAKEEEERLLRLSQKKIQMSEIIPMLSPIKQSPNKRVSQSFILDADITTKESLLSVHPTLTSIMKEHQMDGVKFMWDTCFESVEMVRSGHRGGGCILAHCMGLGKSLQVITLIHTILSSDLPLRTVLVCCPLSTVLNWVDEFKKWLRKINSEKSIKIYELSKFKKHYERSFHLEDWHKTGGVFIMGYEMFRLLTNLREAPDCKAHVVHKIRGTLLNPGPDLVVCDEGHLLKNDNTILAKLMNRIHTQRRIILTGTPLQNNLREYYCMVNFVKPNLLGSRKEYTNRFENPILNGQHRDSSVDDINIMKKRSHVLHKMLEGCVQRKEATLLYKYLPRKREYVLLVTLSECQTKIYSHYLSKYANSSCARGTPLLKDFHLLQKIWTHPRTLHHFFMKLRDNKLHNPRVKEKVEFSVDSDGVICLEDIGDVAEESLATPDDSEWLGDFITEKELEELECSPKFTIAFQLLEECILSGDKMLIFSMSLFTLDALEYFLRKKKQWLLGKNYYRLDGSMTLENRQKWCRNFNSEKNKDVKLFLISTRAGGLGINMIAANRVIIMDVSWNPSQDIQSIFRVFRFGQKKDCYIYRLVAMGTMEETIYERSVTKQAISLRVVDEQQIDRHYSTDELSELYSFNPVPASPRVLPSIPSDEVLAAVLASSITNSTDNQTPKTPLVWSIHEHDSLLRDLHDEQLPEEERVAAWLEYQAEKEAQRKQKEKERSRQVAISNCIIPDNHLPSKNPKRARLNAAKRLNMTDHMDGNDLLQPVSFRNVVSGMVRSNYQNIPPPVKPFTLGSYSAIIQQMLQVKDNPTSMAPRSPQIEATSYQIPFSYQDMYELGCTDGFNNKTVMDPPSQEDSLNASTQCGMLLQISNIESNWDGPSTSTTVPNQLNEPGKKKSRKKGRNRNRTSKKKTPPRVPERISISDDDHVIYLPPVINGYNSSDAESIVPDCNDSPVITIESD